VKEQNAEKPVKRSVTAGETGLLMSFCRCLQPSVPCRNDHRAGFKVLGVTLARLPLVSGHTDMGTRLLR